jgi:hypothetical protein
VKQALKNSFKKQKNYCIAPRNKAETNSFGKRHLLVFYTSTVAEFQGEPPWPQSIFLLEYFPIGNKRRHHDDNGYCAGYTIK